LSRSRPTSLTLARWKRDGANVMTGVGTGAQGRGPEVPERLAVRWERQDDTLIMWLSGELDQATVTLVDRELDRRAIGVTQLVVDLTGLEFIDSPGLDALVSIHWRASRQGDGLSFRHGLCVAQRPVQLTRSVRRRSRWAAGRTGTSSDDFYLALALACVDVDHLPPDDQPEAA
jgi:anti-anti-sigma factor